jgi:molecular chaperone DnaK
MTRSFVDYGIDLGTTNSCLAVFENGEAKVLKNKGYDDYTPSAVYYDKNGSPIVGHTAKSKLELDPQNAFSEFKLQMGSDWKEYVPHLGKEVTPEKLSAEVLRAVKGNLLEPRDEIISAAVITVPAAFGTAKSDATRKAAQLAGILYGPLLQEPVAAALAYGFERTSRKAFWLVYDFGGGTFDAAVIKSHDGIIEVVNHEGDNHLGGKLIDWAIVEELLIPEVKRVHGWTDFERGNPNWIGAVAKLKGEAEKGKIRLSSDQSYEINEFLEGGDGKVKRFEFTLQREQIESLTERYIRQSIGICKKVLAGASLQTGDIEKVLLVGGPTLMPYLQGRLKDPADGLGISLECNINPMTVVAQGAAIFAANDAIPEHIIIVPPKTNYQIKLDYRPLGNDPKPLIGGKVTSRSGAADFSDYRIRFVSSEARTSWQREFSLSSQGTFTAELWAPEENNTFLIELFDSQATKLDDVEPKSISYTLKEGGVEVEAPLTHSIGIALTNNEVEWFCRKGTSLPFKDRLDHLNSAYHFRRDQVDMELNIPIVEGENERADRNQLIGYLKITAERLERDIRAGDEFEVEIEIDKSRKLTLKAYTPALLEEIKTTMNIQYQIPNADQLKERTQQVKKRLEKVKETALEIGEPKPLALLNDLDRDGIIQETAKLQAASPTDPAERDKWEKKLRELAVEIDDVEDELEIHLAIADGQKSSMWAQKVVENWGNEVDRQNLQIRQRELLTAIRANIINSDDLRRKTGLMYGFAEEIYLRHPESWIEQVTQLEKRDLRDFTNSKMATQLLSQARTAINANEIERLKTAVRQLWQLLPQQQPIHTDEFEGSLERRGR